MALPPTSQALPPAGRVQPAPNPSPSFFNNSPILSGSPLGSASRPLPNGAQPSKPDPCPYYLPGIDRAFAERFLKETSDRANGRLTFVFRDSSQAGQYVVTIYYQGNYQHNLLTSDQFINWPGILRFYNLSMGSDQFTEIMTKLRGNTITELFLRNEAHYGTLDQPQSQLFISLLLQPDGVNLNFSILEQSIMSHAIRLNRSIHQLSLRLDKTGQTFCPFFFEAFEELSSLRKIRLSVDGLSIPHIAKILQRSPFLEELELPNPCSEETEKSFVDALAANLKLTSLRKIGILKSAQESVTRNLAHLEARNLNLVISRPIDPGTAFLESVSKYSTDPRIKSIRFTVNDPMYYGIFECYTYVDLSQFLTVFLGALLHSGGKSVPGQGAKLSAEQQQKLAEMIRKGFNGVQSIEFNLPSSYHYPLEPCVVLAWESKSQLKEIIYDSPDNVVMLSAVLRVLPNLEKFSAPRATPAALHEYIVALAANTSLRSLKSVSQDPNQAFLPETRPHLEILRARNPLLGGRETPNTFDEIANAFQRHEVKEICFECIANGFDPKYSKISKSGVSWSASDNKLEIVLGLETKQPNGTIVTALTIAEQLQIADMIKKCPSLVSFRVWVYDKATYLIEGLLIEAMMNRKIYRLTVNCEAFVEETSRVLRSALSLFALNWGHCPSKPTMTRYLKDMAENMNITGLGGVDSMGWDFTDEQRKYMAVILARNKGFYNAESFWPLVQQPQSSVGPGSPHAQAAQSPASPNRPVLLAQPSPAFPAAQSPLSPASLNKPVLFAQPNTTFPQAQSPQQSGLNRPVLLAQPSPVFPPAAQAPQPAAPVWPPAAGANPSPMNMPPSPTFNAPQPVSGAQSKSAGIGLGDALGLPVGAGFGAMPAGMMGSALGMRMGASSPVGSVVVQRGPSPSPPQPTHYGPVSPVQPQPQPVSSPPAQMSFTNYSQL